jgi:hypothetical protein
MDGAFGLPRTVNMNGIEPASAGKPVLSLSECCACCAVGISISS